MDTTVLLVFVALITFFFVKYFNAEDPMPDTESEYVWVTRNIDQVLVMFPHTDTAALAYALSRTRSVEGCIEKLLAGETLPAPPEESRYHGWNLTLEGMDLASARTTTTVTSDSGDVGERRNGEPSQDDLIKRYNLQNRVYIEDVEEEG